MIYEIRTYDLVPRSLPEFERRVAPMIPGRLEYSAMTGMWQTEAGPLNQVVHIWPYEDLGQRTDVRARAVANGKWPPDTADLLQSMETEIFLPAPFMRPMEAASIGPLYEMRIYTYPPQAIPKVLDAWAAGIDAREKLSPLVGCWYSEIGALNKFVHMWAYKSFEERLRIRADARSRGIWPPPVDVAPVKQENKILLPMSFSPLQ